MRAYSLRVCACSCGCLHISLQVHLHMCPWRLEIDIQCLPLFLYLCVCVCVHAHMCAQYFCELVLSFHRVLPELNSGKSGLMASTFPCCASLLVPALLLKTGSLTKLGSHQLGRVGWSVCSTFSAPQQWITRHTCCLAWVGAGTPKPDSGPPVSLRNSGFSVCSSVTEPSPHLEIIFFNHSFGDTLASQ